MTRGTLLKVAAVLSSVTLMAAYVGYSGGWFASTEHQAAVAAPVSANEQQDVPAASSESTPPAHQFLPGSKRGTVSPPSLEELERWHASELKRKQQQAESDDPTNPTPVFPGSKSMLFDPKIQLSTPERQFVEPPVKEPAVPEIASDEP